LNMKKLYRSERDKKISGLCGGLAGWLGIDANILRLIVIVAALFSFGTVAIFYVIASVIVPKEPFGSSFMDGHNFH
jgi:phage shock protein C